ncbi:hypothetical protein CEUSTIGMA_g248.t1 [Chlamydomonas eustigma]|uniref:PHD-type domain-containing protein n=1 Tax=Chlamydomonas eustigma TaxID=1157962 RepID=A0A250WPP8_9CHLO|nr:hypothetical protein CEUSTIGMA_g248.t1 [Chlamydomonas eustigma]|eukprot:GAX72793.1 hypothetical protein CEUSTIGMA_g248.t1 [Chlamydomonas eustigma]
MQTSNFNPPNLAAAVSYGEQVFSSILDKAEGIQRSTDVVKPPNSWSDSLALVIQREEEKRKKDVKKEKAKSSKSNFPPIENAVNTAPGSLIGHVPDQSVFWMFMEDYFRDLTPDDFHLLKPIALEPDKDDALTVPFLGREKNVDFRTGRTKHGESSEDVTVSMNATTQSLLKGLQNARPLLDSCTQGELESLNALLIKLGLIDPESSEPHLDASAGQTMESHVASTSAVVHCGVQQTLHVLPAPDAGDSSASDAPIDPLRKLLSQVAASASTSGVDGPATSDMWMKLVAAAESAILNHSKETDHTQRAASSFHAGPSHAEPLSSASQCYDPIYPNYLDHSWTAQGDFIHPLIRMLLARKPTAYVLDPRAHRLCSSGDHSEEGVPDSADPFATVAAVTGINGGLGINAKGLTSALDPSTGLKRAPTPAIPSLSAATPASSMSAGGRDSDAEPSSRYGQEVMQPLTVSTYESVDMSEASTQRLEGASGSSAELLNHLEQPSSARASARPRSILHNGVIANKTEKEANVEQPSTSVGGPGVPSTFVGKVKKSARGRPSQASLSGGRSTGGYAGSGSSAFSASAALFSRCAAGLCPNEEELALYNPVVTSVARCIAEGPEEKPLEEQWGELEEATGLLTTAPDDEVAAEMLIVQAELVQQMAINRYVSCRFLQRAIEDVQIQQKREREKQGMEVEIQTYVQHKTELKRIQKREMREQQRKQAAAALLGNLGVEGPQPSSAASEPFVLPPEMLGEMIDPLTLRGPEDEAFCAVCGDGSSLEPNQILFCERCDVAVHQGCYGLGEIPQGEWLCWPCSHYESEQNERGMPKHEIRPPRWEMSAQGLTHASLPGGSTAVTCCLCPVRHGAFKQTTDTAEWVHVSCGLWHPEAAVLPGNVCRAVHSRAAIKADKFALQCMVCQLPHGAVVKCSYGQCQNAFHPLCGRRTGQYIAARAGAGGRASYRSYCAHHSDMMRQRDIDNNIPKGTIELVVRAKTAATYRPRKDRSDLEAGPEEGVEHLDLDNAPVLAALEAISAKENEAQTLMSVRFELDRLRLISDQVRRREKLKRQVSKTYEEEMHLRARIVLVPEPAPPAPQFPAPTATEVAAWGLDASFDPQGLDVLMGSLQELLPEVQEVQAPTPTAVPNASSKRAPRAAAVAAAAARAHAMDLDSELDETGQRHTAKAVSSSPRVQAVLANKLEKERVAAAAAAVTVPAVAVSASTRPSRKIVLRTPSGRTTGGAAETMTSPVSTMQGVSNPVMTLSSGPATTTTAAASLSKKKSPGSVVKDVPSSAPDLAPPAASPDASKGRSGSGRIRKQRLIPDSEMGDLSDTDLAMLNTDVYEAEATGGVTGSRKKRKTGLQASSNVAEQGPPAQQQQQPPLMPRRQQAAAPPLVAPTAPRTSARRQQQQFKGPGLPTTHMGSTGEASGGGAGVRHGPVLNEEEDMLIPGTGAMSADTSMFMQQLPGGFMMDNVMSGSAHQGRLAEPAGADQPFLAIMNPEEVELHNSVLPAGYKYMSANSLLREK